MSHYSVSSFFVTLQTLNQSNQSISYFVFVAIKKWNQSNKKDMEKKIGSTIKLNPRLYCTIYFLRLYIYRVGKAQ